MLAALMHSTSAKIIVPEAEGYSETQLQSMMESLSFPSAFFDQPERVRGVLFAAGSASSQLARDFAERHLRRWVLSIGPEASTQKSWTDMSRVLAQAQTTATRIGILLPNLDRVPVEAQKRILAAIQADNDLRWFPSANDFRNVIPPLRQLLLVYLGLDSDRKMQVLIQSGQTRETDKDR